MRLFSKNAWKIIGSRIRRGAFESRINFLAVTPEGLVRKQAGSVFTRGNHRYDPRLLIQREAAFLAHLGGRHAPRVIAAGEDWLEMEHCGVELNAENIPISWREQVDAISAVLKDARIVHRDIKHGNVLVKDSQLYLIDFGWAIWEHEDPYVTPRELSGDVPHELIYDNQSALNWLLSCHSSTRA
jgi:serine/threonine protein kinase